MELNEFPVLSHVKCVPLPVPNEMDESHRVRVCAALVAQALQGKQILFRFDSASLLAFELSHNLSLVSLVLLFCLLGLAFFERSSWCWSADSCLVSIYTGSPLFVSGLPIWSKTVSLAVEIVLLVGLLFSDSIPKLMYLHPRSFAFGFDGLFCSVVVCAIVDCVVSFCIERFSYRLSPYLRVVLVGILGRQSVYAASMVFYRVLSLFAILAIFLMFFAWMGLILWANSAAGAFYFSSFGMALANLQIALTTANYPDIMLPAYKSSPASLLFYVAFYGIGLFFLLPLVLASVFSSFKLDVAAEKIRFRQFQLELLGAAFSFLDLKSDGNVPFSVLSQLFHVLNVRYLRIPFVELKKEKLMLRFLDQEKDLVIHRDEFQQLLVGLQSKRIQQGFSSPLVACFPRSSVELERFSVFVRNYLSYLVDVVVLVDLALVIYSTIVLLQVDRDSLTPWIQGHMSVNLLI